MLYDPERLSSLYKILDQMGNTVTFEPNWSQQRLLEGLDSRNVHLKVRRQGITTCLLVKWLDTCLFAPDVDIGILSWSKDSAWAMLRTIQFIYGRLPEQIREWNPLKVCTHTKLVFANGSSIEAGTKFHSPDKFQILHVSEYALMKQEIDINNPFVVVDSIARGKNHFHKLWTNPDWKSTFFPWYEHPGFITKGPTESAYLDTLEKQIGRQLADGQRAWWVEKYRILGIDVFREYPNTAEEAFA